MSLPDTVSQIESAAIGPLQAIRPMHVRRFQSSLDLSFDNALIGSAVSNDRLNPTGLRDAKWRLHHGARAQGELGRQIELAYNGSIGQPNWRVEEEFINLERVSNQFNEYSNTTIEYQIPTT